MLGMQHLESRGMLAGDVVAISQSGGTLNIVGDSGDNAITLSVSGGSLTVTPAIGTTISGIVSPVVLADVTKLVINMGAGDDDVTFAAAGVDLTGINVMISTGTSVTGDSVTADDLKAHDLAIVGGNGADVVDIDGFTGHNVIVKLDRSIAGPGQSATLHDFTLTGGTLSVTAGIASDPDSSEVTVSGATTLATTITVASAGSGVTVDGLSATNLNIRTGTGIVDLGTTIGNSLSGPLTVNTAADSAVTVGASGQPNVTSGLTSLTIGGNSSVNVVDATFAKNVSVKLGNGAANAVSFNEIDITGRLAITLGNSTTGSVTLSDTDSDLDISDSVSVIVGSATTNTVNLGLTGGDLALGGSAQVVLGTGAGVVNAKNLLVSSVGTSKPGLTATTRTSNAKFNLDTVEVEGSIQLRSGNGTTGGDVDVTDATVHGSLQINLGTATMANDIDIHNADVALDLAISAMNDTIGTTIDILASDVGRNLSIATRDGADTINIDGAVGDAMSIVGRTSISTGADGDTVKLGFTNEVDFGHQVNVNLDGGDDSLTVGVGVDDLAGAFVPGAYLIGLDGGPGADTITSHLTSFKPATDLTIQTKIKNFETKVDP